MSTKTTDSSSAQSAPGAKKRPTKGSPGSVTEPAGVPRENDLRLPRDIDEDRPSPGYYLMLLRQHRARARKRWCHRAFATEV